MSPDVEIDFEIIWKKINGSISSDEEIMLDKWINQSTKNKQYFEHVRDRYNGQKSLILDADQELGWYNIQRIIARERRKKLTLIASVAASVLILFGLVFQSEFKGEKTTGATTNVIASGTTKAYLITSEGNIELDEQYQSTQSNAFSVVENSISYKNTSSQKNGEHILRVPKGGEYQLTLSDGTKVWLNAASELTYPVVFGDEERVVKLNGEAYFDVAHDATRPFKLISEDQEIMVYGTQFNVSCYATEPTITTLVEGSISVGLEGGQADQKLKPGEQSVHVKASDSWVVSEVDTELYTAWKDGSYYFKSEPLGVILQKLSRWYDIDFRFNDPATKGIPFTGRVQKYDDLNDFLNLLEKTNEVKFEIDKEVVFVK